MAKVTSKLQVTIPKRVADKYGIQPGDDIDWVEAGESIRVVPGARAPGDSDIQDALVLFDAASARQRDRQRGRTDLSAPDGRGWGREDLYERGRAR